MSSLKRWLNWSNEAYLRGLPEMERFPDDASREATMREINLGFYTWKIVPVLAMHVVVLWAGYFALTYATRRMFPVLARHASVICLVIALVAYAAYVSVALRRDLVRDLRRRLHALGVPICVRCGYDLRGASSTAAPCPECGAARPSPP